METSSALQNSITSLFAVDSIGSIVVRGIIWLVIALVIIISTDAPSAAATKRNLRRNLGFLLFLIMVSGTLIYLLFGFTVSNSN